MSVWRRSVIWYNVRVARKTRPKVRSLGEGTPNALRRSAPPPPKKLLWPVVFMGNERMRYRIQGALDLGVDLDPGSSGNEFFEQVFEALVEDQPAPKDALARLIDPVAASLNQLFTLRSLR